MDKIKNNCKVPLISIIAPVYNVASFLDQCIDSLVSQTYKNIEIILVNDGSTDNSLDICNNWKNKDSRIHLINKKNTGVSDTRNVGLLASKGEYIIFVDSDDYLDKTFVEYMYNMVSTNNSDFGLLKNCFTNINQKQISEDMYSLTNDKAIALILSPYMEVGCWNKIYKRKLLFDNNITFNTNLFYGEGLNFIINVSLVANNIICGEKRLYFYRRNNINSATTKFNLNKFINGEKSLLGIYNLINLKSKSVIDEWNLHLALFYINSMTGIIQNNALREYDNYYKDIRVKYKKVAIKVLLSSRASLKNKLKIFINLFFPKIWAKRELYKNNKKIEESI